MVENKRRLIYVDDILSLYNMSAICKAGEYGLGCIDIINDIKNAPTVDAVEVVRCKDCAHYEYPNTCHCHKADENGTPIFVRDDDFCSYGERKEQ